MMTSSPALLWCWKILGRSGTGLVLVVSSPTPRSLCHYHYHLDHHYLDHPVVVLVVSEPEQDRGTTSLLSDKFLHRKRILRREGKHDIFRNIIWVFWNTYNISSSSNLDFLFPVTITHSIDIKQVKVLRFLHKKTKYCICNLLLVLVNQEFWYFALRPLLPEWQQKLSLRHEEAHL